MRENIPQKFKIKKMKLSIRDKDLIYSCIVEEVQNNNNKVISEKDLDIECERNILKEFQAAITIITEKALAIKNLQSEFHAECDKVRDKIQAKEEVEGIYFGQYNPARDEVLKHLKKTKLKEYDKLYKKYNIIPVPDKFTIEKLLIKSETKDVPTLIKEITNIIMLRNEYTEIQK